jgi:hypothetical protein
MNNLARRAVGIAALVAANVAIFAGLFLLFEIGLHMIWPDENPFLGPPFAKSKVRIASPIYGHTLAPNYEGY